MISPPDALLDNRSDPKARAVLADWYEERGIQEPKLGVILQLDVDVVDVVKRTQEILRAWLKGDEMREGLKLLQLAGQYGRAVTLLGWLKHVQGDEWELLNQCTLTRTSGRRRLSDLAENGPGGDHKVSAPSKVVEEVHRLLIRRPLRANEEAWLKHCPKPKDWVER